MKTMKKYYLIIIPTLLAIFAAVYYATENTVEEENDIFGIIETDEVDIAAKIPGRIDSLFIDYGDAVEKGDTLAKLESKEMDAKLEQARSVMLAAKAKFEMATNGARKEEKEAVSKLLEQAKYQFEFAKKTYERMESLYKDSVISKQKLDEIEFKYKAAKAQYEAAEAKLEMVNKGARYEKKKAAEALYNQALNAYREVQAYYSELFLTAPISGEISSLIADQGEIIAAGYPIISIIPVNGAYAVINLKEDLLNKIEIGEELNGYLPSLKKSVRFKVTYISPKGNFATWKPTAQKGEFDLKTFEIRLKPVDKAIELRPGMNVKFNF